MNSRNLKIVVLGDRESGKTALVSKAVNGTCEKEYKKTIGANFSRLDIVQDNEQISLEIWDYSSQQSVGLDVKNFAVVCCDFSKAENHNSLGAYIDRIRTVSSEIPIFIVLTKADLAKASDEKPQDIQTLLAGLLSKYQHCYYLGTANAPIQTQDKIQDLFKQALSVFDKERKKIIMDTFFEAYDELKKEKQEKGWRPAWLSRTHLKKNREEETFESLVKNGLHKKTCMTNQAFLKLGWFNRQGETTDATPSELTKAAIAFRGNKV